MNGPEKSDSPIVAVKPANEAARAAEEQVEPRGGTKENADQQTTARTQSREAVSQAQARIRKAVTRNRTQPLTALLHHVGIDVLRAGFFSLKKTAAPGVDGLTWTQYAGDLEANLQDLHARVHRGGYRALASRRRYIPKADGRRRPLGIAALEDKIVQAAVAAILTPIYEAEFLGFSYGFRPERGQHDALDALAYGLGKRRINWVLDADIRSFCMSGCDIDHIPSRRQRLSPAPDPLPIVKQEASRRAGVMTPSHARAESEIEPANAIDRATSPTIRRSNISAIAPAGVDTSATGSINDVWTSATIPVEDEIFVIAQAAPTPRTRSPRLDNRLAVQMRRNTA